MLPNTPPSYLPVSAAGGIEYRLRLDQPLIMHRNGYCFCLLLCETDGEVMLRATQNTPEIYRQILSGNWLRIEPGITRLRLMRFLGRKPNKPPAAKLQLIPHPETAIWKPPEKNIKKT